MVTGQLHARELTDLINSPLGSINRSDITLLFNRDGGVMVVVFARATMSYFTGCVEPVASVDLHGRLVGRNIHPEMARLLHFDKKARKGGSPDSRVGAPEGRNRSLAFGIDPFIVVAVVLVKLNVSQGQTNRKIWTNVWR